MAQNDAIPNFRDLLERIEALEPGTRKRDLKSAVSSFAKAVGQAPEMILAVPHEVRRLREGVSPLALGIDPRRWANICSGVTKAIELVQDLIPSRNTAPLHPAWEGLLAALPPNLSRKLSAGLRHLGSQGILPATIGLEDLQTYLQSVVTNRMRRNAEQAADHFIWAWNRTVAAYPNWPQITLPRHDKRNSYTFPLSYFPQSFEQDVQAYVGRLRAGILFDGNLDEEDSDEIDFGPMRPVRPATVKRRTHQLRQAASCLVHSGIGGETITSIAVLVDIPNVRLILKYLMHRNADGQTSGQVEQMASFLAQIAQHWVKVDPQHHRKLKALVKRVAVQSSGMTAKNRERLRPFDDDKLVEEFVCLPDTIRAHVEKDRRPAQRKAVLVQTAAAIAILTIIPLRVFNLAAIDIDRHLISNRNGVYLVIPEAETKNREPINFVIPSFALEIVRWYMINYRPYLTKGDNKALFPGRDGGSKAENTLAIQIKDTIKKFLGLDFNVHLFRHAAGKIFLDNNPGNYEVVRQILRHKSMATTTSAYSGAETRQAGLVFAGLIENLRQPRLSTRRKGRTS